MEVVGCDGGHVGTVDDLTATEIKLAKNDPDAGGQEHYIPLAWLLHAEIKVHLNLPSYEAKSQPTNYVRCGPEMPLDSLALRRGSDAPPMRFRWRATSARTHFVRRG
jgi:hypothetical protein